MTDREKIVVVVPALNEAARVAKTVLACRQIPGVDEVIVVDDGSNDATGQIAEGAGARVYRQRSRTGKAAALERGVLEATRLRSDSETETIFLFLDADLEETAKAGSDVLEPVIGGSADMAIATIPRQGQPGGGQGFVVTLARQGVLEATGFAPVQPLSGQRAIRRRALESAMPLAKGFGIEVGLTIDVIRSGFAVVEVPANFHHRVTGRDLRSQVHRGRQFWAVWRALRSRGVGPALPIPVRGPRGT